MNRPVQIDNSQLAHALGTTAAMLHGYLTAEHWKGSALVGPDSGIRFNSRIGRFLKSYLPFVRWTDELAYMQTQGYWVRINWHLHEATGEPAYSELASASSAFVLSRQTPDGYWEYPNGEWKGRVATVEGCYAGVAMAETYLRTRDPLLLEGVCRWCEYLVGDIGFQRIDGGLAVNYFRGRNVAAVPNNSTLVLKLFAAVWRTMNNSSYLLEYGPPMLSWLRHVVLPSGELPYSLGHSGMRHFLCYQYNAFEFLDLLECYEVFPSEILFEMLRSSAAYLATGIGPDGAPKYDCTHYRPEVLYYGAAIATALRRASQLALGDYDDRARRAMTWVISHVAPDGAFQFFSRKNYFVLQDRRSYPRNLAMVLYHCLIYRESLAESVASRKFSTGFPATSRAS